MYSGFRVSMEVECFSIFLINDAYQLELEAELVVLSCCESGIGKLAEGEGMMAVNRGFLYAGASNIVYSLFKKAAIS